MTIQALDARGLFSLLFHGDKAIDVVESAWATGLLRQLDAGPVTLAVLSRALDMIPGRLDKLLDCLESLGLVERQQVDDDPLQACFVAREPLHDAAELVVGPRSIERDRNRQPWQYLHGRLPEVLRGAVGIPEQAFSWPPASEDQHRQFEASMAAGVGPIAASFAAAAPTLWADEPLRILDVGGGDGSLACALVAHTASLRVDVYNLPSLAAIVADRIAASPHRERLGFVPGDFFAQPLPAGYDVLSFVRVLHDWPDRISRTLLEKAHAALAPGGRVIICEELRTPARLAVQFFWSYFLTGVDSCVSRLRPVEDYLRVLPEVGFGQVTVIPGPFDILVASRK